MNKPNSPIRRRLMAWSAPAALCAMLASCGGGGSDSGFLPTAAAGLYERTGGGVPAIEALVLDSGRTYTIYGMSPATAVPAGGVIVADVTTVGTGFTSGGVHDLNMVARTHSTGTAAGTFVPKTSIAGTITYTAGSITTFSGNYSNSYEQAASLTALAGTYGGETADLGETRVSVVTVNASGVIAGSTSTSCTYAGSATPHAAGNVFDVTVTFGSGCTENGNTLRGHAFVSHNVLYVVVVNGDMTRGVLFAGVKS